jgi:hypothetical protein
MYYLIGVFFSECENASCHMSVLTNQKYQHNGGSILLSSLCIATLRRWYSVLANSKHNGYRALHSTHYGRT